MDTKQCRACREVKPCDQFLIVRTTGKIMARCKSCHDEYKRQWHYGRNKEVKEYLFNLLSNSKCNDCGGSDLLTLEFDHQHSKHFNIGKAHLKTLQEVKEELAKCIVLCANCHKKKTHQEQNTWRYQMLMSKEGSNLL